MKTIALASVAIAIVCLASGQSTMRKSVQPLTGKPMLKRLTVAQKLKLAESKLKRQVTKLTDVAKLSVREPELPDGSWLYVEYARRVVPKLNYADLEKSGAVNLLFKVVNANRPHLATFYVNSWKAQKFIVYATHGYPNLSQITKQEHYVGAGSQVISFVFTPRFALECDLTISSQSDPFTFTTAEVSLIE